MKQITFAQNRTYINTKGRGVRVSYPVVRTYIVLIRFAVLGIHKLNDRLPDKS